jgi:uncharacterized protein (DUF1810 family)
MADRYDLQRFLDPQQPVYARVIDELRAGEKHSRWMWFIFPQIISQFETTRISSSGKCQEPSLRPCAARSNRRSRL